MQIIQKTDWNLKSKIIFDEKIKFLNKIDEKVNKLNNFNFQKLMQSEESERTKKLN